jgi:hypothetical protein
MKIVIASYNREEILINKTLKFIDLKFGKKYKIYVFTPSKYTLPSHINIIKCDIGLIKARNAIMKYFKVGEKLLCLDDDIEDMKSLSDDSIETEILKSFKYMKKNNINLGGFNPTYNEKFSSKTYKSGLYFCVGFSYMLINDKYYSDSEDELEDYDRSIKYYLKYGANFRNDNILVRSRCCYHDGGMGNDKNNRYKARSSRGIYLLYKYPNLVLLTNKKDHYGIKLMKNSKTIIQQVNYNKVGLINGLYSKYDKSSLDEKKNYFFVDNNKIIGYILRNLYKLDPDFKYSVKSNQNSGDIAGIIEENKLPNYAKQYFKQYSFNKQHTRTSKTSKFKFEMSNQIKRHSRDINSCNLMSEIYKKISGLNYFNDCNKIIINKDLCSGFHRDSRNVENYVILLTKNNKLILDIPEYNLILNNNDGDIVVFDAKTYFHGNNEGDSKDRYSIVFYNAKSK